MATSVTEIKKRYPIPVYYYEVMIDKLDPIAFSEVSGLDVEFEPITYRTGMSYKEGTIHMPGMVKPIDFSLKKGIIRNDNKLLQWFTSVKLNTVEKKDITITLKDESHNPVVTWRVKDAFPLKLHAPTFDATSNEVAIEQLDLRASDLKITYE